MRNLGARALSGVAAATCLIVGLAACSGDPKDPPTSPTTSSTPAPTTPAPTGPTEPALPEAAKANTPDGAAAFVKYYIALMNYSAATGDTKTMKSLSQGCHGCGVYINLYESTYAAGGYFEHPDWQPISPIAYPATRQTTVLLDVNAPDRKFLRRKGDEVRIGKGGRYKLRFVLSRAGESWLTTQLTEQTVS